MCNKNNNIKVPQLATRPIFILTKHISRKYHVILQVLPLTKYAFLIFKYRRQIVSTVKIIDCKQYKKDSMPTLRLNF